VLAQHDAAWAVQLEHVAQLQQTRIEDWPGWRAAEQNFTEKICNKQNRKEFEELKAQVTKIDKV
jgi:hypothetical protein